MRTPLVFVPYLVALAAILGGLLWYEGDVVAGFGRNTSSGLAQIGGPFRLTDQNGSVRTDADFRGRFMLVYFGYTNCPDVCPTTLGMMADALGKLGPAKDRVVPVFVSIDPEHDAPKILKDYLKAFGPEFVGLTGSLADIKTVAKEYRVYFAKHPLPGGGYAVDHSSVIYLVGPDGKFATFYDDESIGPDALAADLKKRV